MFFKKKKEEISTRKIPEQMKCPHGMDPASCHLCNPPREEAYSTSGRNLEKQESVAPIFVKVEKYKEVLEELQEIKSYIGTIKQLFLMMSELEATRSDAMNIMKASVQRLEKAISEVDTELLRPVGYEAFPHGEIEIRHIEDSLINLQRQLSTLRQELDEFRQ